jgi:hypothetical protein
MDMPDGDLRIGFPVFHTPVILQPQDIQGLTDPSQRYDPDVPLFAKSQRG